MPTVQPRRLPAWLAALIIALALGGGGYFAWWWAYGREEVKPGQVVQVEGPIRGGPGGVLRGLFGGGGRGGGGGNRPQAAQGQQQQRPDNRAPRWTGRSSTRIPSGVSGSAADSYYSRADAVALRGVPRKDSPWLITIEFLDRSSWLSREQARVADLGWMLSFSQDAPARYKLTEDQRRQLAALQERPQLDEAERKQAEALFRQWAEAQEKKDAAAQKAAADHLDALTKALAAKYVPLAKAAEQRRSEGVRAILTPEQLQAALGASRQPQGGGPGAGTGGGTRPPSTRQPSTRPAGG